MRRFTFSVIGPDERRTEEVEAPTQKIAEEELSDAYGSGFVFQLLEVDDGE